MASWSRTHVIKAAFLVCVVLLILLNFCNFRSKFDATTTLSKISARPSTTMQWPMRPRSEQLALSASSVNRAAARQTDNNNKNNSNRSATKLNLSHPLIINNPNRDSNIDFSHKSTNDATVVDTVASDSSHSSYRLTADNPIPSNLMFSNENLTVTDEVAAYDSRFINSRNESQNSHSLPTMESNKTNIETISTKRFLTKLMTTFGLNACPLYPPNLDGPIDVSTDYEPMATVEERFHNQLLPGGWYKPIECNAKDRVAIVIPYRDRSNHLPVFLKNIHPLLMKQQIEYGIFVIEQIADGQFNRAALMNVGFVEALKLNKWDCFIFHDVDLLPMDDRNLYRCPDQPRHMSVAVDTMGFKLPYSSIFGGVSAMTVKQFQTVNGFSNSFWGWGGEDDDMSNRLKHVGYHIARYPVNIARYTMLSHRKEKANPKRYEKLVNGAKKFNSEGLNSLKYKIHCLERKILYTWILAEIKQDSHS